jgi:hypothetical protein
MLDQSNQLSGREREGATNAELRHLLLQPPKVAILPDSPVIQDEYQEIGLAVEQSVLISGYFIALRGWLADPKDWTHSIWLEVNGEFRRVRVGAEQYRDDLIHYRGLRDVRPGLRAGFAIIEPWPAKLDLGTSVYMHVVFDAGAGLQVISSGVPLRGVGSRTMKELLDEFLGDGWAPPMISRVARPLLRGVASSRRRVHWKDRRLDVAGQPTAEFSYIVAMDSNAEVAAHLLGFIEMDPKASDTEVIFVLQSPLLQQTVNDLVRAWRGVDVLRAIKVLCPASELTFGSAIWAGIELSTGRALAISTDEMIPPEGGWIEHCLAQIDGGANLLIPAVQTFDGRPIDFSHACDLPWEIFEHDHSGIRTRLLDAHQALVLDKPYGAMIVSREFALEPRFMEESFTSVDLCFLDFYLRRADSLPAVADSRVLFTHNRLPEYAAQNPVERLWNLYAIASAGKRGAADSLASSSGEPRLSAFSAPAAADEPTAAADEPTAEEPAPSPVIEVASLPKEAALDRASDAKPRKAGWWGRKE